MKLRRVLFPVAVVMTNLLRGRYFAGHTCSLGTNVCSGGVAEASLEEDRILIYDIHLLHTRGYHLLGHIVNAESLLQREIYLFRKFQLSISTCEYQHRCSAQHEWSWSRYH